MNNPDLSTLPATMQTRWNPPGLSILTYRGGRYVPTLNRLLRQLPFQVLQSSLDDSQLITPLANLNTDEEQDWTIALVHAWAAVLEVLAFYQERMVNEGYWQTAREYRSIFELSRTIGYELAPGVAAGTYLAFNVLLGKNEPPRAVTVPAGVQIQSVPPPGQLPQTFETSADFVAWSDWNALKPIVERAQSPALIRLDDGQIRLAGITTGLQVGSPLLIVGDPAQPSGRRGWLLGRVTSVILDMQRNCTALTWDLQLLGDPVNPVLNHPQFFALRQTATLFNYTRSGIYFSPELTLSSAWQPESIGVPHVPVHTLIASTHGAANTLFAGTGKGLFTSTDQGTSWQSVALGLAARDILTLIEAPNGHLYAGTGDGGVYLSQDHGITWRATGGPEVVILPVIGLRAALPIAPDQPLPKTVIRALAIDPHGRRSRLAAGTDSGVLISGDQGRTWRPMNADLPKVDPKTGLTSVATWTLAVAPNGWSRDLFAGTDAGVFRIIRHPNPWRIAIAAVIVTILAFLLFLISLQSGGNVDRLESLRPTVKVLAKAVISAEKPPIQNSALNVIETPIGFLLFVAIVAFAITNGLNRLAPIVMNWRRISLGMPVHALIAGPHGQLFAGTEHGIYRSNDSVGGTRFQRFARGVRIALFGDLFRRWQKLAFPDLDVRTLAVDLHGNLLAGTLTGLLYCSSDNGATWQSSADDLPLKSAQAICPIPTGIFAVGTPRDLLIESGWAGAQITNGLLDLDKAYPDVQSESWLLITQAAPADAMLAQVGSILPIDSADAVKAGRLSRITLNGAPELSPFSALTGFDRTAAALLIASQPFDVYADAPVWRNVITFDHLVLGLTPGKRLIVSGKQMRARLTIPYLKLTSQDGLITRTIRFGNQFWVIGVRYEEAQWLIQDRSGFEAWIAITAVTLEAAADDDDVISESVTIDTVSDDTHVTTVTLRESLINLFDRSTVTVYANVTAATHGKTVNNEILGTSAGMSASQHFSLKQLPLTYISAPTDIGYASTLKVSVNGIRWDEVPYLYNNDLGQRVFAVRRDANGGSAVVFGDSQDGAGVPGGTQQITATYRIGSGEIGNVAADSLTQLQTAVPGIKGVTNPIPASGGADPEPKERAQSLARLHLRSLHRIVSLTDYEDFGRVFPGIGKAKIAPLTRKGRPILVLTVAGEEGSPVLSESDLYQNLTDAYAANRALPLPALIIDSFEPVYFNVEATLLIDSHYWDSRDLILADALQALLGTFSFDARDFVQPIAASEVIVALHSVTPGTVAVENLLLYPVGATPALNEALTVKGARNEQGILLPAQMLLINPIPSQGIRLHVEIAL